MTFERALSLIGAVAAILFAAAPAAQAQERASPPRPGYDRPDYDRPDYDRPGYDRIPPGSYQDSCRGISLDGNLLRAQCPGRRGAPIFSTLDINGCRGRDIQNDDGYLRCNASGGPRPPWPPGPGPGPRPPQGVDAIGYTLPDFGGRELPISGPIQNLANYRGFNDQIRSLRVFRGGLQVCADKNYRGRCVVVRESYRNLDEIGMSATISSIR